MTRIREDGYCAVVMIDGSGSYRLPRSEYERVRREWMAGAAFVDTVGIYGSTVTIKCARIEGVTEWSPEALDAEDADLRAQKSEDVISGEA